MQCNQGDNEQIFSISSFVAHGLELLLPRDENSSRQLLIFLDHDVQVRGHPDLQYVHLERSAEEWRLPRLSIPP